jgi:transposase-like protein
MRPWPTSSDRRLIEQDLIRAIRDARFAHGLHCPRCAGTHVLRWGTFSGRQRYRCRDCRRTFSDLTATPFAYSKRLSRWPAFLHLFHEAVTVRRSASVLDVQVSTAFRWRHATLDHVRSYRGPRLSGVLELKELTFPLSFKGSRKLGDEGRRRGARVIGALPTGFPRTQVIMLRSRADEVRSSNLGRHLPTTACIGSFLRAHVEPGSAVICRFRRMSPYGSAIHAIRCDMITSAASLPHLRVGDAVTDPFAHLYNVERYARRYLVWLERFRGVATHYLNNYLAWHSLVDRSSPDGQVSACLRLVVPQRAGVAG